MGAIQGFFCLEEHGGRLKFAGLTPDPLVSLRKGQRRRFPVCYLLTTICLRARPGNWITSLQRCRKAPADGLLPAGGDLSRLPRDLEQVGAAAGEEPPGHHLLLR